MSHPALALIGFGEAGQALAAGWRSEGVASIAAWDILFPEAQGGARLRAAAERLGVRMGRDAPDAVRGADIVFSAVTAASNLEAAGQAAAGLSSAQFYVELNSVSPNRKRQAAEIVGSRARFVGMAVMAPVHPLRHKTPVLVSGPAAADIVPLLRRCGMDVADVGPDVGAAAAVKMVRSVMVVASTTPTAAPKPEDSTMTKKARTSPITNSMAATGEPLRSCRMASTAWSDT